MPPAPFRRDDSADDRAQCGTNRNGNVEYGQRIIPFRGCIAVGNQARTDGGIARFAQADEDAKCDHHRECPGKARQDRAQAPYKNAGGDESFARPAVTEPAEDGRRDKISEHERRHEPSGLTVIDAEIFLQRRQHRREHIAVTSHCASGHGSLEPVERPTSRRPIVSVSGHGARWRSCDGICLTLALTSGLAGTGGIITKLTVSLNISGGYNGDLYAYLAGPNGGFAVHLNRAGIRGWM